MDAASELVSVCCNVSIIIVSWNTRDILRDCLTSVFANSGSVPFEVVVVDNGSQDGTAAVVRREFPQVTLIANADNRGFAAANNQGMRLTSGRYCLFLNPDTVVIDGCIEKVVRFVDRRPDIGVVGCQVLENETQVQQTCFRFPSFLNMLLRASGLNSLFRRSAFFNREQMGEWDRASPRDVDVVSGMFMLVRRQALDNVGVMDEDYFVYCEEADWCYRFWRAGWRCVFAPVGQIVHRDGGSKSTEQVGLRMFVQQQKSLLIFHRKHLGWWSWAATRTLLTVAMLERLVLWGTCRLLGQKRTAGSKVARAVAALKYLVLGMEPA